MSKIITSDLLSKIPKQYQEVVEVVFEQINQSKEYLDKVCELLSSKLNDKELSKEFLNINEELKKEACLEYLVIGLVSGSLNKKDLKKIK